MPEENKKLTTQEERRKLLENLRAVMLGTEEGREVITQMKKKDLEYKAQMAEMRRKYEERAKERAEIMLKKAHAKYQK